MWLKIIFAAVLIAIIVYTLKDSAAEILDEILETTWWILLAICLASVVYHLFEAWITCTLARRYNPRFRYREGLYCAFQCSFYRLSTLGSGSGVAAVVYLGKKGVGYSEAMGLYMIQYVVHKVSIVIFSGLFFLLNWNMMIGYFKEYLVYLLAAYVLTVLISVGLVLFAVSAKFHRLLLRLGNHFNKKGRFDKALKKLASNCEIMEHTSEELLKDAKTIVTMWLKDMAKLCFWYCIPFLVMGMTQISVLDSWSVTSLAVMTAAVIPTPAGIGSTELIMTSLYSVIIDTDKAVAVMLLYRFATFIFPFLVGGVLVLAGRIKVRRMS